MRYIITLERTVGNRTYRDWIETVDLTIWRNPKKGQWIDWKDKEWEVKFVAKEIE